MMLEVFSGPLSMSIAGAELSLLILIFILIFVSSYGLFLDVICIAAVSITSLVFTVHVRFSKQFFMTRAGL